MVVVQKENMNAEDSRSLDLLTVFHYVFGGAVGLFSCCSLVNVAMGVAMLSGHFYDKEVGGSPILGKIYLSTGASSFIIGWLIAISVFIAARQLKARKNRFYCMLIACVECLFLPMGAILGVFTLITLKKESVKEGMRHL